jgi:hypothetical protein
MASPAERFQCREVLYCCQSASIPGVLLYQSGELCFVQFETKHWLGYRSFGYYSSAVIFPEHLRLGEQLPEPSVVAAEEQISRVSRTKQFSSAAKETAGSAAKVSRPSERSAIYSGSGAEALRSEAIDDAARQELKMTSRLSQRLAE